MMTTYASHTSWGATANRCHTQGLWSTKEATYHINTLGMLAIKLDLRSLFKQVGDQHIWIMSNNITTVSYINEMGGCKSKDCNSLAKDIWLWAVDRNNWLSADHTPGHA
jgi:hypothetical protein